MLTVCTGWSPAGWVEYGKKFVDTFAKWWPDSVELVAYVEEPVPLRRGKCRSVLEIPGCREFLERHRENRAAQGLDKRPDWKPSAIASGYNWRWDAVKFCRQAFIPHAAAQECKTELLCWLDADVVTFSRVPPGFIEGLLPKGRDVAYLGRAVAHSEIGFQLYRLPHAMPLLKRFSDYYATDEVFKLPQWHSAYVWDAARREACLREHNLTPNGNGHVWWQSPLCKHTDHLKGKRKQMGMSQERKFVKLQKRVDKSGS